MPRSVILRKDKQQKVLQRLLGEFFSQQNFAEDLGIAASTVSNFINLRPVDRKTFIQICKKLSLNWRDYADFPNQPSSNDNLNDNVTSDEPTQYTISSPSKQRVFISYKRNVEPDEPVAIQVYQELSQQHNVFIDQRTLIGKRWAECIETELRSTDFLIVFLSEQSVNSEMVQWEISLAVELAQSQGGKPVILPVRLAYQEAFPHPLSIYLNHINWAFWESPQDTSRLIEELRQAIHGGSLSIDQQAKTNLLKKSEPEQLLPPTPFAQPVVLEMPSGTMKPESAFYVERNADAIALGGHSVPSH
ncbi:toll/interleukin-1 receptor domain-containing protein [Scytonema sp. PCC 10023]|uniref:toll/interleukin-1 receptor domain-containing protein n=1 Tax=Scytonema sp. PCC 10023 TaxID=1680591 RepID=UPI0039C5B7AA